ncbi:MAG: hypothetical protein LBF60_08890 [Treponema sp.]|jgi:hypothetical protein|nr:hypothetical protein [Treponema sp.]
MKIDDPEWWNDVDKKLSKDEFLEVYNAISEHTRMARRLSDDLVMAIDDGKVELGETRSMTERLLKVCELFDQIKTTLSDSGI